MKGLEALFSPHRVALIGSMSPGKLGAELAKQILAGKFAGELLAVNPKGEGWESIPGRTSLSQESHPVDLAVIVSPSSSVAGVLEDCGQAGVRAAVVITSGFSEIGNRAGEEEILRAARKHGICLVGPNCAGIANTHWNFFPTLELRPPQGSVALVSQSGALGGAVLARSREIGLGISKFVSYGNGAGLSEADFLEYLSGDPQTRVVALYIESVRDGRRFMHALRGCCQVNPVVVIKAGRTSVGKRATASHTGSMAGSDEVYSAAIRQCGAIRVRTVEEMMDLCSGFVSMPLPAGRRFLIVTNSGGPGVLAADWAEEQGLEVAQPSEAGQAALREFLPAHCALKNPIDLTVEGTREGFRRTLETLLPEYDSALAMNVSTPYLDSLGLAQGVIEGASGSGKAVAANFLPAEIAGESVEALKQAGIPNYESGERAAAVLAGMARYAGLRATRPGAGFASGTGASGDEPRMSLPGDGPLTEPEAMAWLSENGVRVPDFRLAHNADQAVQACRELGWPVVMKVVSPQILHKSDVGGVVLGIRDEGGAREAFHRLEKIGRDKDFRGVLVTAQLQGGREVLVGLSRDAQFGPVVVFGLGGIYTEILKDVSLRTAPVDDSEAMQMIREVRSSKLLMGARGEPPGDIRALAVLISRVSQLPLRYPEVAELDLNPVFVFSDGVVAADARVIRTPFIR